MNSRTASPAPLIELRKVVKVYDGLGGRVTALNGIDLQVFPGEFLVVTGKSGSGKTTLVNMITALDRLTSGEAWVAGAPIHRYRPEKAAHWRGDTLGVVFQTFELLPTLTVLQNVMLPMDFSHHKSIREQYRRAMYLLEQVGIAEHARKLPAGLSGGQQQRLSIARAMANDPQLLVADEPTGSLDFGYRRGRDRYLRRPAGAGLYHLYGHPRPGHCQARLTHHYPVRRRPRRQPAEAAHA